MAFRASSYLAAALGIALQLGSSATTAQAENLAQWNLNGIIDSANPLQVSILRVGVAAGDLVHSANLTSEEFSGAFVASDWPSGPLDPSKYFEFSITPNSGLAINYDTVEFSLYNNHEGTSDWELRSSVDGFSSALDAGSEPAIHGSGAPISADISSLGTRSGTVTFRIYTFNNTMHTTPPPHNDATRRGLRGSQFSGKNLWIEGTLEPAPSYTLDVLLTYAGGTLTMDFLLGSDLPVTWTTWLIVDGTAIPLWSVSLPIFPPTPFSAPVTGFPDLGVIGVLSTFDGPNGIVQWDFGVVDTSLP